jgi:hypothetical protein
LSGRRGLFYAEAARLRALEIHANDASCFGICRRYRSGLLSFPAGTPTIKEAVMAVSDVKQAKTGDGAAADSRTAVRTAKQLKGRRVRTKMRTPKALVHN